MTKSARMIRIGTHRVDLDNGTVTATDGASSVLRHQTLQVLAILAESAGEPVTKQVLMETVWPDTFVTDDSLVQCISEIRKALGPDDGAQLRTLPKIGYRLDIGAEAGTATRPARRLPFRAVLAAGVAMIVAAAILIVLVAPAPRAEGPITIAVMPFRNMSGEPSQDYLSNGVAEDLIVGLSGISDLRVLSRGTSFAMAGQMIDNREIARTLRADYVLEGSVRRTVDDLRVSAALVDGTTGANVWAGRYEGVAADMFAFQDSVLTEMMRVLSVRLSKAERDRLGIRGTQNVDAHDAYLRGRELENLYTADTNREAETALQEAIRHDPGFALAYAHLAQVYSFRVENNWTEDREPTIAAAFDAAETALTIDPDLPFGHFSLGRLYTRSYASDLSMAIAEYETAIRLDPNYVDAYMFLANVHIFDGQADKALPLIAEAFDRNPVPPYWYYLADGMAQYFLGDYEKAEAALIKARDQNPTAPFPYRFLMATYGQMGEADEADWMAMEYEALGRIATVTDLLQSASIHDPAYREIFADGFRKAGLPEE